MKPFIYFVIILVVAGVASCASRNSHYADDRNYFFKVRAGDSREAEAVKLFLEKEIPRFKYSITHDSGYRWPYYKCLGLKERITADSLMPPHTFVHKMVPYAEGHSIGVDEFVVEIDVFPLPDTFPNYSVTIFRQTPGSLQLSATSGIHFIEPAEYKTLEQLNTRLLENILRYSFK